MKRYKTKEVVYLGAGKIELSAAQAETRRHLLKEIRPAGVKPAKPGLYQIEGKVCFKAGEEIGIEGNPGKAVADQLEPIGKAEETKAPDGTGNDPK